MKKLFVAIVVFSPILLGLFTIFSPLAREQRVILNSGPTSTPKSATVTPSVVIPPELVSLYGTQTQEAIDQMVADEFATATQMAITPSPEPTATEPPTETPEPTPDPDISEGICATYKEGDLYHLSKPLKMPDRNLSTGELLTVGTDTVLTISSTNPSAERGCLVFFQDPERRLFSLYVEIEGQEEILVLIPTPTPSPTSVPTNTPSPTLSPSATPTPDADV